MARSKGLADLQRRIRAMAPASRQEIAKALEQSAKEIASVARRAAPKKTGKLAASIRTGPGRTELSRTIEAGGPMTTKRVRDGYDGEYDYALGVEWGTADTPAQPFFYPSWRLGRKRAISRTKRSVSKAAKRAGWSG